MKALLFRDTTPCVLHLRTSEHGTAVGELEILTVSRPPEGGVDVAKEEQVSEGM